MSIAQPRAGGPIVCRMRLGARLRRLREANGITRERAGYAIRGSESKISRIELGRVGFKERDITDLLLLYGVTDTDEHERLMTLTRAANAPGWWYPYNDVIPSWFQTYLALEEAATLIRTYEIQLVPGLLQTPAYTRAAITHGHAETDPGMLDRWAELQAIRKQLLTRPDAPPLWVVLDEAVLRRPIGSVEILREQIISLLEQCDNPNVSLQVKPFLAGRHTPAGGSFTILRFPLTELSDTVYLEQLTDAQIIDRRTDVDKYFVAMSRLIVAAAPPDQTRKILHDVLLDLDAIA